MLVLASGHLGTDLASGALPALLPFLVDRFDLSYTLAAVVMLASTVSSSVVQPLFGLWSDRRGAIWLLPGGVALAGIGIALAAAAPTYWLVLVLVVLSGLGIAAYHPEGSKFAAYVSGRRRASGMSAFSIGGNVGFALGPVLATPLVLVFVAVGGTLGAIALAGVGVCVIGTFGVTMVMSQEYLPRHIGVASGLSIGLSIGLGGIAAVALGALADTVDLRAALYVCAAAPVAGLALAALLPSSQTRGRFTAEPVVP
jgi:MFS family permease